jgi:hypothetical protein
MARTLPLDHQRQLINTHITIKISNLTKKERLRKTTKPSVRIAGLWAKIWTWDLLKLKQEC